MFLLSMQDDKDLVPEFVASEGLTCFIKVGAEADHNYQNYILRGEVTPEGAVDAYKWMCPLWQRLFYQIIIRFKTFL